ncbi:sigma-70 family RNA polymerase sigma factor [Kitasatospora sp. NBC_01287]|uniref:sigma-70 family RNA polymerase sigma factor n=1 Tax=Kitasatospora sp. NBC_01287 TaxID=2903573 RepID=UPI0022541CDF|nr:sigma-70 family RNA polymerase sigma factor [Kitasatospora sp. NBC_01287]MCX4747488.1 sigma-70 family RNA polymerase sigma factor [Kitasatospora sp. NBC_01287]
MSEHENENENELLAAAFEAHRNHLRAVAYRVLGSLNEADDAVQEAWLRLHRTDTSGVENLGGWLTTVVGRVCLDMLRSRTARREGPLEAPGADLPADGAEEGTDPEHAALLADSVGLALLVVLDALGPAERLAFVLHDLFAVPFEDIATILDRTPAATRQLASRARRRVQGRAPDPVTERDQARRRAVVDAFLGAARGGDFDALLAVLDPDVVLRADRAVPLLGAEHELHGRASVLNAFLGRAQDARTALLDGVVGAAWAPGGQLRGALRFTITDGRITTIDVVADADQLSRLDVDFLDAREA